MNEYRSATRFQALVADFSQSIQIPHETDADLLSIVVGEMQALVRPHPLNSDHIAVVIEALPLEAEGELSSLPADKLLLLHRLNNAAWTEHEWQILVDDNNWLGLRAIRDIGAVSAKILEEWIVDGLERARALVELWRDADFSEPSAPTDALPSGHDALGVIRG
jgi:hypothetical protein